MTTALHQSDSPTCGNFGQPLRYPWETVTQGATMPDDVLDLGFAIDQAREALSILEGLHGKERPEDPRPDEDNRMNAQRQRVRRELRDISVDLQRAAHHLEYAAADTMNVYWQGRR